MLYEISKSKSYHDEIIEALNAKTKNSNFILTARTLNINFSDEMDCLLDIKTNFRSKLKKLVKANMIGSDDYSIVVWKNVIDNQE